MQAGDDFHKLCFILVWVGMRELEVNATLSPK